MKNIKIFGDLASYGEEFTLDVRTPGEAIRAIEANRPGFISKADGGEHQYVLVLVSDDESKSRQVTLENSGEIWGDETLYIVPKVYGSYTLVVAAIVWLGASLAVAEVVATVVMIAISMAISALASLISGTNGGTPTESLTKASYLFNGVVNTSKQGVRVPLLYGGPLLVGSMVLSFNIDTGKN